MKIRRTCEQLRKQIPPCCHNGLLKFGKPRSDAPPAFRAASDLLSELPVEVCCEEEATRVVERNHNVAASPQHYRSALLVHVQCAPVCVLGSQAPVEGLAGLVLSPDAEAPCRVGR